MRCMVQAAQQVGVTLVPTEELAAAAAADGRHVSGLRALLEYAGAQADAPGWAMPADLADALAVAERRLVHVYDDLQRTLR